MRNYKIAIIKGDGIGPEIIEEAIKVLDAVASKEGFNLEYNEYLLGGAAIDVFDNPCPDETIKGSLNSDAVLFGAIGGPKWESLPKEKRPESGLLKLRKSLGLFANIRPAIIFDELTNASSLKPEVIKGVNLTVVRELTGGIYFGEPRYKDDNKAYNTMVYSRDEIARIAKVAFEEASKRNKKVTSVDKANVLEVSELWREIVEEVAKNFRGSSIKVLESICLIIRFLISLIPPQKSKISPVYIFFIRAFIVKSLLLEAVFSSWVSFTSKPL